MIRLNCDLIQINGTAWMRVAMRHRFMAFRYGGLHYAVDGQHLGRNRMKGKATRQQRSDKKLATERRKLSSSIRSLLTCRTVLIAYPMTGKVRFAKIEKVRNYCVNRLYLNHLYTPDSI